MIKNIVFDMGKVLVGYDGMRVCEHFLQDPSDQQQVHTAVFISRMGSAGYGRDS